jgi:N-acetyl-anhydromuramyl-L-alanine amidase AmpD
MLSKFRTIWILLGIVILMAIVLMVSVILSQPKAKDVLDANDSATNAEFSPSQQQSADDGLAAGDASAQDPSASDNADTATQSTEDISAASSNITIAEDYRSEFVHGEKPAKYQKYIVLHDTEGLSSPQSVINYWDSNNNLIAAHFIVGTDGGIYQCVPMDKIAHHAGFGDAGHNSLYGVEDESRDDKLGTKLFSKAFPDYGMNSYSVGIELVHVGGGGDYPKAQLDALDSLIAHIDNCYGFQSKIVAHNDWCSSNSDTSKEFSNYLSNYKTYRSYKKP